MTTTETQNTVTIFAYVITKESDNEHTETVLLQVPEDRLHELSLILWDYLSEPITRVDDEGYWLGIERRAYVYHWKNVQLEHLPVLTEYFGKPYVYDQGKFQEFAVLEQAKIESQGDEDEDYEEEEE